MNNCVFSGYVLDKPELKSSPAGKSVCEVRMNVPRDYKSSNGERLSDFISVVAWGRTAELLASCEKGTRLNIITHLRTELYTDKNGIKRESHKYEIDRFEYAERKSVQNGQISNGTDLNNLAPGDYVQENNAPQINHATIIDTTNIPMEELDPNVEELPF